MKRINVLVLTVILATCAAGLSVSADEAPTASANVLVQELVGKILQVDIENSTIELEYEIDEQTHQMQTETFYVTDATTIDVANTKSGLKDLKVGAHILLEYAQMPDGAKVVESVWVKES